MRTITKENGETPTPETINTLNTSTDLRTDSSVVGTEKTVAEYIVVIQSDIDYNTAKRDELMAADNSELIDNSKSISDLNKMIFKQEKWIEQLNTLDASLPIPVETHFFKY